MFTVHYATKVSAALVTCRDINVIYTATEDHTTVLIVLWNAI